MITNILLGILLGFAGSIIWFLQFFGVATLPSEILNNLPTFANFFSTLDIIFPVATILTIIGFQVLIEASIFTYRLVKWTWQKIPGIT